MPEIPSASERFLKQLAAGLEALGPHETEEVLTEIRSHLAEATADANGDADVAVARFGSPDVLAVRVLEERGVLAGGSTLPGAPPWRQFAALVIDVVLWLFIVGAFCFWPIAGLRFASPPDVYWVVLGWAYLAAVAGVSVWWWAKARHRRGHVTTGMYVMNLYRVRVGETTRIVRNRDIPGLARRGLGRVGWAIRALLIVLFVGYVVFGSVWSLIASDDSNRQQEIQSAVRNALNAESMVRDIYEGVIAGGSMADLPSTFAPGARDALAGLVARHAAGKVESYWVANVELPDHDWSFPSDNASAAAYELVALVEVAEVAQNARAVYRYRAVTTCNDYSFDSSGGFASFETLIQSVEVVEP